MASTGRWMVAALVAAGLGVTAPPASALSYAPGTPWEAPAGTVVTPTAVDSATHDLLAISSPVCPADGCASPRPQSLVTFRDGALVGSVALGADVGIAAVTVDSGDHRVYLAGSAAGDRTTGGRLLTVAGGAVSTLALDPALGTQAIAVDPGTHTVYVLQARPVTDCDPWGNCTVPMDAPDDEVAVVRGGRLLTTIAVPAGAKDLAVDTSTHLAYVVGADGTTVLDGTTVKETLPYRGDAVAVDSSTHDLWLAQRGGGKSAEFALARVRDGITSVPLRRTTDGFSGPLVVDPVSHEVLFNGYDGLYVVGADGQHERLDGAYVTRALDPARHTTYLQGNGTRIVPLVPTERPVISRIGPYGGDDPARAAYVVFSRPMDRAATRAAVTLTDWIGGGGGTGDAGTFTWYGDQVLLWTPPSSGGVAPLWRLAVGAGAKDATGRLVVNPQDDFVAPRPVAGVEETSLQANWNCAFPGRAIWARWTLPVDPAAIAQGTTLRDVTTASDVPLKAGFLGTRVLAIAPQADLVAGHTVTLTIPGDRFPDGTVNGPYTETVPVVDPARTLAIGPADGATGVAPDAPVYAVFSQPMQPQNLAGDSLELREAATGAVVRGAIVTLGGQVAGFRPAAPLKPGTRYMARVWPYLTDATHGCAMASYPTWSFTTGAAGTAGTATGRKPRG